MALIHSDNVLALWAVMMGCAALSIWLESRFKWAAKVTALVIVLFLGIVLSNLKVIPTQSLVYDQVWDYLIPLAMPMLLYRANIKKICRESGQMLLAFLFGALGTVIGTIVAFLVFRRFIPELGGLSAMMTGTYIGGSVNFAALSDVFDVSGSMISAATIADNLNMALYIFVLLAIPVRTRISLKSQQTVRKTDKKIKTSDLAICIAAAFAIVWISTEMAARLASVIPTNNAGLLMLNSFLSNKYFWITTVSVCLATFFPKFFAEIGGAQELGILCIYCFMFVIGAPASIREILVNSPLLLVFAMIIVAFNMIFTFAGGRLLKLDRAYMIIASNANIGGPTTAASMAIARGWEDLVGPALLIGSLGYVIGNYLGSLVGYLCMNL